MLEDHEGIEYLYVFHELVSHKQGLDIIYAISKTFYFQKEEQFYKQHEMLQDDLEALGIKDESESIVLSGFWEWRYYYDNEDSNWVEYDVDVNRKFYYENIPFNF